MNAYQLFDSRSFATKMEMALSVLARKRPKPTQEEQGEAFQPILDHILAMSISPSIMPANRATEAQDDIKGVSDAPLRQEERILPPTQDQIAKENAGQIQSMLTKIHETGKATPNRTFTVVFDRSEGGHVQELSGYLQSAGLPYSVVSIGLGGPSVFEQHTPGDRANGWNVVISKL